MRKASILLALTLCSTAWAATAVTTNPVNLRRAASTSAPILATIPKNTLLTVACQGQWCRTTYRGQGGYVSKSLTQATSRSVPLAAPTAPSRAPSTVYYASCAAARAAGAAPISAGQPGYRARLDRDNDGVACE
ncbi:excalibur calcium-binding domain-containing protein [Deinococcus radiopugnans]|uniref:Ligand-binding protein SH3 n=1 Tax=Deinococcus radiopugnans ATCC 19172 TaxID=585398 RepID=A0A5C4Y9N9_9DEIO|nr:excalibur calcium-binding domain-containing protein [Deinococcus radiopugnans]MBB6015967.1 uncharacterized protein YraI [Deinococcus radiopugnans ATCC 19172]TNM72344.1 ligand-binding protein SH3 [Deinococcus radiopugnans ATCC 19172]